MGIEYRKILIIQLQPVGDVVRTTPVITELRRRYPQAEIAFLVYDRYAELLRGNPKLNVVIPFNRERLLENIRSDEITQAFNDLSKFATTLQEMEFDLVINLHNTYLSGILAYLARAKECRGVMVNKFGHLSVPPGWLFNLQDYQRTGLNMVEIYLKNAGLETDGARLEIYLEEEDLIFREEFLEREGINDKDLLIGLNPGAGVYSRRWPKERFAEIGDRLAGEYGARVIIFGGRGDVELVKEMVSLMRSSPINAAGKTSLKQLAALIQRCNLFITNDTGPMHIAAAIKTPIVAIFGSSMASVNSPHGDGYIVLQADLPCIPCNKSYCEDHSCMKSIGVDGVLRAAERVLNGGVKGIQRGISPDLQEA